MQIFDREAWQEILDTISKNKLRTILTAFSVAWGIFMLIILLGAGQGLQNGASYQFKSDAVNSIWVNGGQTSKAYKGFQPGRNIQLTNEDYQLIHAVARGSDHQTASYDGRAVKTVVYGKEHGAFLVRSCMPDHDFLENCTVITGRFINEEDIRQFRKVCAMGVPVRDALFRKEYPVGKYIAIDGIPFMVVGVFTDPGRGDNDRLYIPVSTAQRAFNGQNKLGVVWLSTGQSDISESNRMASEIRHMLASRYQFDPEDERAVNVNNNTIEFVRIMNLLSGIRLFIWIIGIGTIIAGIVGVSNIMMISVKERTKEIGVRKALGATPGGIIGMIIKEAILITGVAGYFGLVSGVLVLETAKKAMPPSDFFRNPEVDFGVAISATFLLILSGALAGLFPALRAARVEPVVALRDE